jgi:hypothetical protein
VDVFQPNSTRHTLYGGVNLKRGVYNVIKFYGFEQYTKRCGQACSAFGLHLRGRRFESQGCLIKEWVFFWSFQYTTYSTPQYRQETIPSEPIILHHTSSCFLTSVAGPRGHWKTYLVSKKMYSFFFELTILQVTLNWIISWCTVDNSLASRDLFGQNLSSKMRSIQFYSINTFYSVFPLNCKLYSTNMTATKIAFILFVFRFIVLWCRQSMSCGPIVT